MVWWYTSTNFLALEVSRIPICFVYFVKDILSIPWKSNKYTEYFTNVNSCQNTRTQLSVDGTLYRRIYKWYTRISYSLHLWARYVLSQGLNISPLYIYSKLHSLYYLPVARAMAPMKMGGNAMTMHPKAAT